MLVLMPCLRRTCKPALRIHGREQSLSGQSSTLQSMWDSAGVCCCSSNLFTLSYLYPSSNVVRVPPFPRFQCSSAVCTASPGVEKRSFILNWRVCLHSRSSIPTPFLQRADQMEGSAVCHRAPGLVAVGEGPPVEWGAGDANVPRVSRYG